MNLTIVKYKDKTYYGDLSLKCPIYGSSEDSWLETVRNLREDFKGCKFNCNAKKQRLLLGKFGICDNKGMFIFIDNKTK